MCACMGIHGWIHMVPLRKKLAYYTHSHARMFTVARPYVLHRTHACECIHFLLYTIVRVCRKLRRISHLCSHQLKCQACASVFISSVIGFSASSPSGVGLRLPFSLLLLFAWECALGSWRWSVHSDYVKQRILFYHQLGKRFIQITLCLAEEGHTATKIGVCKYIHRYKETGMISRTPGSRKASKFTADAKKIIEKQIEKDDEMTGKELQKLLAKNDIQVALSKWNRRVAPPYADISS